MRRQTAGVHLEQANDRNLLESLFLVRADRAFFRWPTKKPFLRFVVLESVGAKSSGAEKLLWSFVLHRKGSLEIELVLAGLRLRCRTPKS